MILSFISVFPVERDIRYNSQQTYKLFLGLLWYDHRWWRIFPCWKDEYLCNLDGTIKWQSCWTVRSSTLGKQSRRRRNPWFQGSDGYSRRHTRGEGWLVSYSFYFKFYPEMKKFNCLILGHLGCSQNVLWKSWWSKIKDVLRISQE